MSVHHRLLEQYDSFRPAQRRLELDTMLGMRRGLVRRATGPIVIPVVVHVVHRSDEESISVAQVRSQITALNRDYRAKNTDKSAVPAVWKGFVADAGVAFALATKDPMGKKTNGITRTKTLRSSFGDDDAVKSAHQGGADPWPTDRYLNIWVCTLADGLLGYAQFPGGPPATDGVVILHSAFGTTGTARSPFDRGRTTTHEVGHWLNLRHIWGDTEDCSGGDFVEDTPNAAGPNYGSPAFPHITCNNGPNGDMFMNYMDYVDDRAMVMFTIQQVSRMQTALAGPRKGIGRRSVRR
jgi:hypothetical protein